MNKILYNFIGLHSILIGSFIFFIPIFLYKNGFSISLISLFISLTGLGFAISLYFWDRLRYKKGIKAIITISFLLEILIIFFVFIEKNIFSLILFALILGVYNCFFWVTKRILFANATKIKELGNKFGNIQIIGFLLVKIGIFIGAFLLDSSSYNILFAMIILVSIYGIYYFLKNKELEKYMEVFSHKKPVPIKNIFMFKDNLNSKIVFLLDGPFLFFESFFWIISLFFITSESYTDLGFLIIGLAISFSVLFLLIKRKIDMIKGQTIFYIATILYAISWGFRGYLGDILSSSLIYSFIVIITFFTIFFRLMFNKQFFNIGKKIDSHEYIVIKSYYSQISIFLVFGILTLVFSNIKLETLISLNYLYYLISIVSLLYLAYRNILRI